MYIAKEKYPWSQLLMNGTDREYMNRLLEQILKGKQ
jgi:hypothetical protein